MKTLRLAGPALLLALAAGCGGGGGGSGSSGPVTFGIEPWTVAPGQDHIWCKTMKAPSGSTLDVSKWKITMTPGSHHFILYSSPTSLPDGFGDCPMDNLQFVVGSQTTDAEYQYPQGLAMPIFAGQQLVLQSHYVNASTSPITGQVTIEATTIPHSQVTNYLETFLILDDTFSIPPMTDNYTDGGKDQQELAGLNILSVTSHMHMHGIKFTIDEVDSAGTATNLFTTTQWSGPPITTFSPPRASDSSKKLHYQCWWNNDTTSNLVFGPSALTNEMCIMVTTIFPALDYHP